MARTPQVTRTILTTKASVLCLDLITQQPVVKEITLPRTYKDEAHLIKVIKAQIDNDAIKAVHIQSAEVVETLYGMTEQKFIELADILPPRKQILNKTENE